MIGPHVPGCDVRWWQRRGVFVPCLCAETIQCVMTVRGYAVARGDDPECETRGYLRTVRKRNRSVQRAVHG